MADKIAVPILFDEKGELYTISVSAEQYKQINNGDQEILEKLVAKKKRKNTTMIQQKLINTNNNQDLKNSETIILLDENDAEDSYKDDEKGTFNWPEKAVMLFLELYREREHEFTSGLKRHNKLWSEIASEMQNLNYNVSAVQVQNKMSSLKRTYKKIKDSNAKSGNHNSTWAYYSVMDSLYGDKSWVSPPAVASSDGPIASSTLASSSSSSICSSQSSNNFECQDSSSPKPKKRKVESLLESFMSDIKSEREILKKERKKERLEKEKKKEQRWEVYRKEKKEMHKETSEIQRNLVHLLNKLVDK